jgi:broad specificity phosphatase PhoE
MNRLLVIIRHAHRDTTDRSRDNGLSDKGKKQALILLEYFERRAKDDDFLQNAQFLSSPKKRCIETLKPIADRLKVPIGTNADLEEQRKDERFDLVDRRARKFLSWWTNEGPEVLFISSHGDILPLLAFHMLGTSIDVKKGSWLEVESSGGQTHLLNYIRSFKYFPSAKI